MDSESSPHQLGTELRSIDQSLSDYAVYSSYFDNETSREDVLEDDDDDNDEDDVRLSSMAMKHTTIGESATRQKSPPPGAGPGSRPPSTRQRMLRATSTDSDDIGVMAPDPELENLDYTWLIGQDGNETLTNPTRRPVLGELWRFDLKARCSIEADAAQSPIRELAVDQTESRLMTCAKNGLVKIWDLCSHPVRQLSVYKVRPHCLVVKRMWRLQCSSRFFGTRDIPPV